MEQAIIEVVADYSNKPKELTYQDIMNCSGATLSIDTETTGLRWYQDDLITIGIHCPEANVYGYMHIDNPEQRKTVREVIRELEPGTTTIFHNAKFDLHFLGANPEETGWNIWDTTILAHLVDSRWKKALKLLEKKILGTESKRHYVDSAPAKTKIWDWSKELRANYCYNDTWVTHQLATELSKQVMDLGLWNLFRKEMVYLNVVWNAERHGIPLDYGYLDYSIAQQEEHWHELEERLWDSCGYEFNWRSHQQLSKAIYEGLGIPKPKNPYADADGIDRSRFADAGLYKSVCTSTFLLTEKVHHPLGPLISALREAYRMWRTMTKYKELTDDKGYVHANFKMSRTRTGRLSCSDPNLQNVPSLTRGRFTQSVYTGSTERAGEYNLRKAFLARPGYELLSVDWKQMEMRMFGILAQDDFMLTALKEGLDIHAEISQRVWGMVDRTHREWSKTIGFGLIYGMTVGSLMHKLNKKYHEAKKIQTQYLHEFPRIMPWMNEVIDEVRTFGYVRYWNGRIWREENPTYFYRGANAKIQGGCAEILSIAAIRVHNWCREQGSSHNIVSFVHDEIITEVPKEDVRRSAEEIAKLMEVPDLFGIPFFTDAKSGISYGDQEKLYGKRDFEKGDEDGEDENSDDEEEGV